MVMHTINSSTKKAGAGASPILGQLQLHDPGDGEGTDFGGCLLFFFGNYFLMWLSH